MLAEWQIQDLLQLMRRRYRGWEDFDEPAFVADEIAYKRATAAKFAELFSQAECDRLIGAGEYEPFLERLEKLCLDNNLLWRRVPSVGETAVFHHPALDKPTFCTQVRNLLYADRPSPARLQSFSDYLTAHHLPNKWPLPTYLLFMCQPNSEFLVRSAPIEWFLKFMGAPQKVRGVPDSAVYAIVLDKARVLLRELRLYGARDMVDVQSFVWVCAKEAGRGIEGLSPKAQIELDVPQISYSPATSTLYMLRETSDILEQENMTEILIPRYYEFMRPVIQALKALGGSGTIEEIDVKVAEICGLSASQLNVIHDPEKGDQTKVSYRIAWARTYLKKYGLIDNPLRGIWSLTPKGEQSDEIDPKHIAQYVRGKTDFNNIDQLREISSTYTTTSFHNTEQYFSEGTFELLEGLRVNPTKSFYQERQEQFKVLVERPFQKLFYDVAALMPLPILERMETEKRLFSHILKNDYGQGGTWTFYWGAFYPKGGKRINDAQLFMSLHNRLLKFGFSIGEYGQELRQRFKRNTPKYTVEIETWLSNILNSSQVAYGSHETFDLHSDGTVTSKIGLTYQKWLQDPEQGDFDISYVLPKDEVLQFSSNALCDLIAQTYTQLFPLVLLSQYDDPLPTIQHYLKTIAPPPVSPSIAQSTSASEITTFRNPIFTLTECSQSTGFPEPELSRWLQALERKKQAVFYGPPGTGKTFVTQKIAQHLVSESDGLVELVQFHPAYAYEDFIQGIRPFTINGILEYQLTPGRFLQFCAKAQARTGPCILIIDEINRANLASVFGELMYLLEYRQQEIPLAGGGRFSIPANVRIIGTMNTADRSIALVDHALRRRFAFIHLPPNYDLLRRYHAETSFPANGLIALLKDLNNAIDDPHYHVGHSFFLRPNLAQDLEDIWCMEIEPYLEEYFFNQTDQLKNFRWAQIAKRILT